MQPPPSPRPPKPCATNHVGWDGVGVGLLGLLISLLLVWGAAAPGDASRQLSAVLWSHGLGALGLLWVALTPRLDQAPIVAVLLFALVLRLIAVQASPLLEDDHYRYLWDGFRTATTLDPYRLAPSAFFDNHHLGSAWQDVLSGINNPDLPTLYGPVLQGLFALAYAIAPAKVGALQGLLLLVDMAVLGLLARGGLRMRWLLVYALHPLVLKEAMASAHPDGLVALFLLLALMAWQRRAPLWIGVALGLAVGTKVVAVLALPMLLVCPPADTSKSARSLFGLWVLRLSAGFTATVGLLYAPFVAVGGSDMASLATFGQQWRFNPLLFRGFEWLFPAALVRPMCALALVLAMACATWCWWRSESQAANRSPPVHIALVLLLLFSPVVNPWYWLWALAPALLMGSRLVAVVAVFAVLSYLNTTVLVEAGWITSKGVGPYQVSAVLAVLQIAVLAAAWWSERQFQNRK